MEKATRDTKGTARVVRRVVVVNQNWDEMEGDWFDGEFESEGSEEVVFSGTDDEVAAYLEQMDQ